MSIWNERYAGEEYFYGTEPNAFLVAKKSLLKSGMSCLAVADGEGRNGVWLAEQGLNVLSLDASPVAQAKAQQLAQSRGVAMRFEQADLLGWRSEERFDVIAAIFIQFVGPDLRPIQFENLKRHLKPGGLLLLQGYTPRQLEFKTGGPSQLENLYTEAMLRELYVDMEIVHLREHDSVIQEGTGHSGQSALIDLVARAR
ncbi:MAG: class I SAM-dependent methyltransferase [Gammaproteobacteria bacterium]|nr:class I SAM-dependent methyltransferase [Gammaproteobacteria bacterium]MBU1625714.1 class I SAM-dependent methyltransferase [Gammaproteobacteria bacterium]MBU1980974.1 class I SAM-dependent methyltransferase [Gammaproteobacteria bacterium]